LRLVDLTGHSTYPTFATDTFCFAEDTRIEGDQ
jgi:hypothetical protein